MLTAAATLAAAIAVSAAGTPLASQPFMPPLLVRVAAASDISTTLLRGLLAEADSVWRDTGVRFLWQRENAGAASAGRVPATAPRAASTLRVVIGHDRHPGQNLQLPLGWIVFTGDALPEHEIYVSYSNAQTLMERSRGIVGAVGDMPVLKRELLLARAMGRALAHELGHYLTASKAHAGKGLMMAVHSAAEFFGADMRRFTLEPAQRQQIVSRITSIYMAS